MRRQWFVQHVLTTALFLASFILLHGTNVCSGKRLLVVMSQFSSHLLESYAVSEALTRRHHEVYALVASDNLSKGRSLLPVDVKPLIYKTPRNDIKYLDKVVSIGNYEPFSVSSAITPYCRAIMEDKELREKITELQFDLALVDGFLFNYCAFLLPHVHGIPYAMMFSALHPWTSRTPALPSFYPIGLYQGSLQFSDQMSFMQRVENLFWYIQELILPTFPGRYDTSLLREYAPEVESWEALVHESVLFIQTRDYMLDWPAPMMPNTVLTPGVTQKPTKPLPREIEMLISGDAPGSIQARMESTESGTKPTREEPKTSCTQPTKEEPNKSGTKPTKEGSIKSGTQPTKEESNKSGTKPTKEESNKSGTKPTKEESNKSDTKPTKEESNKSSTEPTKEESNKSDTKPIKEESNKSSTEPTNKEPNKSGTKPTEEESNKSGTEATKDEPIKSGSESTGHGVKSDGVIFVSFGSIASTFPISMLDTLIEVFNQFNETIIWVSRADNLDYINSNTNPNIHVLSWVPQNDILGHKATKLFVTHCGNNGQHEALYHGVPMVGLPIFGEQPHNAFRIEDHGYGRSILPKLLPAATSTEIVEVMKDVLQNPKYRMKTQKASLIMKSAPEQPAETIASRLEHVMLYGSKHLRSRGMDLPWYQFWMLDILACVLVVLQILKWLIWCGLKNIMQAVIGNWRKTKQKTE